MLELMEILGTVDAVTWQENAFIRLVEGDESHDVRSSRLPPPLHFLPSMVSDPTMSTRDLLSSGPVAWLAMTASEESGNSSASSDSLLAPDYARLAF